MIWQPRRKNLTRSFNKNTHTLFRFCPKVYSMSRLSPYFLWILLALPAFGLSFQLATSDHPKVVQQLLHPTACVTETSMRTITRVLPQQPAGDAGQLLNIAPKQTSCQKRPMNDREIPLTGGNVATSVVRVGATVRKPPTPHDVATSALLDALKGITGVPRAMGHDAQGRRVLSYLPGRTSFPADMWETDTRHTIWCLALMALSPVCSTLTLRAPVRARAIWRILRFGSCHWASKPLPWAKPPTATFKMGTRG